MRFFQSRFPSTNHGDVNPKNRLLARKVSWIVIARIVISKNGHSGLHHLCGHCGFGGFCRRRIRLHFHPPYVSISGCDRCRSSRRPCALCAEHRVPAKSGGPRNIIPYSRPEGKTQGPQGNTWGMVPCVHMLLTARHQAGAAEATVGTRSLILALGVLAILTGCIDFNAREDAQCQNFGILPGTPEYSPCRQRL